VLSSNQGKARQVESITSRPWTSCSLLRDMCFTVAKATVRTALKLCRCSPACTMQAAGVCDCLAYYLLEDSFPLHSGQPSGYTRALLYSVQSVELAAIIGSLWGCWWVTGRRLLILLLRERVRSGMTVMKLEYNVSLYSHHALGGRSFLFEVWDLQI
jgi:hypothetical protein